MSSTISSCRYLPMGAPGLKELGVCGAPEPVVPPITAHCELFPVTCSNETDMFIVRILETHADTGMASDEVAQWSYDVMLNLLTQNLGRIQVKRALVKQGYTGQSG